MAAEYAQLAYGKDSGTQPLDNASQDRQSSDRLGREGILAGLRKTPVYFANVEKIPIVGNFTSRSHGFAIIGDPGKGARSGAVYYGVSGDGKRGGVDVDAAFVRGSNKGFAQKCGGQAQAVVERLLGQAYPSREAFGRAYVDARKDADPNVGRETLLRELKELSFLVPKEKWELWPLEPNGRSERKPNLQERDVRTFEQIGKNEGLSAEEIRGALELATASGGAAHFNKISLRPMLDADAVSLIEAKRQQVLARLYVDQTHGRDGSGFPPDKLEKEPAKASDQQSVAARVPTYQRFPPFESDLVGNCNTGAATLLSQSGASNASGPRPASNVAFGYGHRSRAWRPVKDEGTAASEVPRNDYADASRAVEALLTQRQAAKSSKKDE